MSSKFEDWWNMHNCVKESLMREDARYVYESRQAEVDELQKKYNAMYNTFVVADDCRKEWHRCYVGIRQREDELQERVKELELINFDSELHFDAAKEHIDHLQKRIDEALKLLNLAYPESWGYCVDEAMEILKGEETK